MAKKKSNVGTAGRFGARYGRVARKKVSEVEEDSRGVHECPSCEAEAVKRESSGIWRCRKGGHKFAGGAYSPSTSTGATVEKALAKAKEEIEQEES